jgi:hypothetical protein
MFVTIQRKNIHPSRKEMNKAVTTLIIKITLQWLVSSEPLPTEEDESLELPSSLLSS